MKSAFIRLACVIALCLTAMTASHGADLKSPADFASIADETERSTALFTEMGKVLTHPRCVNCHPRGDSPLRGDAMVPHVPPVRRGGEDGMGVPGMRCTTCHGNENVAYTVGEGSIPGHQIWHLAPKSMAWEGVGLFGICRQIKDVERNGGRSLEELHEHNAEDGLVGWGWNPGEGREPAPGTQALFGALTKAWIDTGAHCPPEG